jgi:uncharacterized membrane protein
VVGDSHEPLEGTLGGSVVGSADGVVVLESDVVAGSECEVFGVEVVFVGSSLGSSLESLCFDEDDDDELFLVAVGFGFGWLFFFAVVDFGLCFAFGVALALAVASVPDWVVVVALSAAARSSSRCLVTEAASAVVAPTAARLTMAIAPVRAPTTRRPRSRS